MSKLRWKVEIEVTEELVADGLEISERFIQDLLASALPYVRSSGIRVRMLEAPEQPTRNPAREEPITVRLLPGPRVRALRRP
jgi:hypothetical protein